MIHPARFSRFFIEPSIKGLCRFMEKSKFFFPKHIKTKITSIITYFFVMVCAIKLDFALLYYNNWANLITLFLSNSTHLGPITFNFNPSILQIIYYYQDAQFPLLITSLFFQGNARHCTFAEKPCKLMDRSAPSFVFVKGDCYAAHKAVLGNLLCWECGLFLRVSCRTLTLIFFLALLLTYEQKIYKEEWQRTGKFHFFGLVFSIAKDREWGRIKWRHRRL